MREAGPVREVVPVREAEPVGEAVPTREYGAGERLPEAEEGNADGTAMSLGRVARTPTEISALRPHVLSIGSADHDVYGVVHREPIK